MYVIHNRKEGRKGEEKEEGQREGERMEAEKILILCVVRN